MKGTILIHRKFKNIELTVPGENIESINIEKVNIENRKHRKKNIEQRIT